VALAHEVKLVLQVLDSFDAADELELRIIEGKAAVHVQWDAW
jgi:hypothetical protein